jgi:hypothetical protein
MATMQTMATTEQMVTREVVKISMTLGIAKVGGGPATVTMLAIVVETTVTTVTMRATVVVTTATPAAITTVAPAVVPDTDVQPWNISRRD